MALMAVTSLQLLWRQYIDAPTRVPQADLDAVSSPVSLSPSGEGRGEGRTAKESALNGPVTWLAKYADETPSAPFIGTTTAG